MIHEYAIHPDFWLEAIHESEFFLNTLCNHIGYGKPCIIAGYPDTPFKKLRAYLKKLSTRGSKEQQAKLNELVKILDEINAKVYEHTVKRIASTAWNCNFDSEHARHNFAKIICPEDFHDTTAQSIEWLLARNCELFQYPTTFTSTRSTSAIVSTIKNILTNSSKFTFVDPFFQNDQQYTAIYEHYFKEISSVNHIRNAGKTKVEIFCKNNTNFSSSQQIKQYYDKLFSPMQISNISLEIYHVENKYNEQEIHNRYILTDICGVMFGHGTGTTQAGRNSSDQLCLLSAADVIFWKNVYKSNSQKICFEDNRNRKVYTRNF